MNPKNIHISDYNYPLPDERIAKYPLPKRDESKLLIYNHGEVSEDIFKNIPNYLPTNALMVFNNTKVIRARLHFRKSAPPSPQGGVRPDGLGTGALIEIFLLEPSFPAEYQENFAAKGSVQWYCLVGNSKKWKEGKLYRNITMPDGTEVQLACERKGTHGTSQIIEFSWHEINPEANAPLGGRGASWSELIEATGELPIPPYLNRQTEESDLKTYQTVYSKIKGSVAAPTAGLHFTPEVLADVDKHGIDREEVTLHVGAGTFKPVKSEEIGGHDMHTEHIAVRKQTIEKLIAHNGEAIAVGTTSVRTLESLYYMGIRALNGEEDLHIPQWTPYETESIPTVDALKGLLAYMEKHNLDVLHSSTQIIIAPGYQYHIVKLMVTNFHQPQSTLLLLVSAFLQGDWHKIYDYALAHDFRFLSYGDSSLLIP